MADPAAPVGTVVMDHNAMTVIYTPQTFATSAVAIALPVPVPEATGPDQLAIPPTDGVPWSGPVAFEEQMTGDGRIFGGGSITWLADSLPWPFRWAREDFGGHDGAVVIGRVDNLYRDPASPGVIFANGVVLNGDGAPPEAAQYLGLMEGGCAGGVSIDGDSAEFNVVEVAGSDGEVTGLEQHFTAMRIRTITAVDVPAFVGAKIALTDTSASVAPQVMHGPAAALDGISHVDLASTAPWDGSPGNFTDEQYQRAAAACDAASEGSVKERCFLPHHDPGGALNINGLHAAAARAGQLKGRSPSAVAAAKRHLRGHYSSVGETPPDSIAAGDTIIAAAIPVRPPRAWFADPQLSGPTPITITADGRLYGHLATRGTCHISFGERPGGGCYTSSDDLMGYSNYDYFHVGELVTDDGDLLAVGHFTFATGHADTNPKVSARAAAAWYDDTGTVGADVRAGEDEYGIWIAGAIRPHLTDEQIREFRSAPPSGDWRRIGGLMEMVAAHAVNTPGFPVPRTRARVLVASGYEQAIILTASPTGFGADEDRAGIKERLAASVKRSRLLQRVGGQ
jgi:hypothetical protein